MNWIATSVETPSHHARVLACGCKDEPEVITAFLGADNYWKTEERDGGWREVYAPTHWMPMPKLPA